MDHEIQQRRIAETLGVGRWFILSYYGYKEYESVAEKKYRAVSALNKPRKKNPNIEPICLEDRALAKNWWGKAWNLNLEGYADYSNRLDRGKSYVRYNAVLDLKITQGTISAEEQRQLLEQFEEFEEEVMGIETHEKLHKPLHNFEIKYLK